MKIKFEFFPEHSQQPISSETLNEIKHIIANKLKKCGYDIEQKENGEFFWENNGCEDEIDLYSKEENKYYLTLFLDLFYTYLPDLKLQPFLFWEKYIDEIGYECYNKFDICMKTEKILR